MKDQKLIRTTYLLGLIPLIGGLTIFFTWWIGKAWFLTTFGKLVNMGILWMFIAFPMGLAGLLTGAIYFFRNVKSKPVKSVSALLCVLINLPVLFWVLEMQHEIHQRAYIRVYNQTGFDLKFVTIKNSLHTESFNTLEAYDHKTGYFYPNYDEFDISNGGPHMEKVMLTIMTGSEEMKMEVSEIYKGDCVKLLIDKDFKLKMTGRWETEILTDTTGIQSNLP